MHQCIKFILFWNDTLRVSDGLSVHYQEFKTVHTATKQMLLTASSQQHLFGQKAFDCVNHEIILAKMKFYGISGIANKLMESYLENRYQRVSVNISNPNKLSPKSVRVKHGVPQGLILGPLLFLIYIYK